MLRIHDPACQVATIFGQTCPSNGEAAGEMGQVRSQINTAAIDIFILDSLHSMAKNAARIHKDLLPLHSRWISRLGSRLLLHIQPFVKIGSLQLNLYRHTDRDMDLVGSCNPLLWIFNFPPPAPTHDLNFYRSF